MHFRRVITSALFIYLLVIISTPLAAHQLKPIKLSPPNREGGRPLMEVLNDRKSSREYSTRKLSDQIMSDMLWAAFGINRPESGKRTAPSAVNWQEIDIYVSTEEGVYLYDPHEHMLKPFLHQDIRAETGRQDFPATAPVNLIFVADFSRMEGASQEQKIFYSATDTCFISQNVYLYCASEGLATVVRGAVDKDALEKVMKLPSNLQVILTQTVGYPAE